MLRSQSRAALPTSLSQRAFGGQYLTLALRPCLENPRPFVRFGVSTACSFSLGIRQLCGGLSLALPGELLGLGLMLALLGRLLGLGPGRALPGPLLGLAFPRELLFDKTLSDLVDIPRFRHGQSIPSDLWVR